MKTYENLFVIGFLFALLGACTPDEAPLNTETGVEDIITERSTQAECEDIEDNAFPTVDCGESADILQCRLNQGVGSTYIDQQSCEMIDDHQYIDCIDTTIILNDYPTAVNRIKTVVAENTDDCPGPCNIPDPSYGCRIMLFSVSFTGNDCPNPDACEMDISAEVYCCD